MPRQILLAIPIISFALYVGLARAQTGNTPGYGDGGFGFGGQGIGPVPLAADLSVQKNIGINDELAARLTALRDELNTALDNEYRSAGFTSRDINLTDEQRRTRRAFLKQLYDEFNPKVKELLPESQYKRLLQIQMQVNLWMTGPLALNDPVFSELRLTDDQKQKLDLVNEDSIKKVGEILSQAGFGKAPVRLDPKPLNNDRTAKMMEVLTDEQMNKLKAMTGPSYDPSEFRLIVGGGPPPSPKKRR